MLRLTFLKSKICWYQEP